MIDLIFLKAMINNTVSINENIKGGKPCINGTRIPVADIVYLVEKNAFFPKKLSQNIILSLVLMLLKMPL